MSIRPLLKRLKRVRQPRLGESTQTTTPSTVGLQRVPNELLLEIVRAGSIPAGGPRALLDTPSWTYAQSVLQVRQFLLTMSLVNAICSSLAARRLNELEIQIKMARTFMKISNIAAVAARWDVSNLQTFAPGAREAGVDLSAYGRGMLETFTEFRSYYDGIHGGTVLEDWFTAWFLSWYPSWYPLQSLGLGDFVFSTGTTRDLPYEVWLPSAGEDDEIGRHPNSQSESVEYSPLDSSVRRPRHSLVAWLRRKRAV